MSEGLYVIRMPVTELIEATGIGGYVVTEMPVRVFDRPRLRREVCEGEEILLVGSVPEQEWAVRVHAIVIEFDDLAQVMKVVA